MAARVADWLKTKRGERWLKGGLYFSLGLGLMVALAYQSSKDDPAGVGTQVSLVAAAALAQGLAARAFSKHSSADPRMVQRSVERLALSAVRVADARQKIEGARDANPTPTEMKLLIGEVSVVLSYTEEGFVDAIADWRVLDTDSADRGTKEART